jgi:hypothetical protein
MKGAALLRLGERIWQVMSLLIRGFRLRWNGFENQTGFHQHCLDTPGQRIPCCVCPQKKDVKGRLRRTWRKISWNVNSEVSLSIAEGSVEPGLCIAQQLDQLERVDVLFVAAALAVRGRLDADLICIAEVDAEQRFDLISNRPQEQKQGHHGD